MTFRVVLTSVARRDLYSIAAWWAENRSVDQASRWLNDFQKLLRSLSDDPQRHPLASESSEFAFELRQILFGLTNKPTHRAIFEIRKNDVIVHRIRHLSQNELHPDELNG